MMKLPKISDLLKRKRTTPGKGRTKAAPGAPKTSALGIAAPQWRNVGLACLTILILSALMSVNLMPDRISLHKGERSTREVRANRSVTYVNSTKTELAKQAVRLATPSVFDRDEGAASNATRIAQEFFDRIDRERTVVGRRNGLKSKVVEASIAHLEVEFGSFSRAQFESLLTVSPAVFQKLRDVAVNRVRLTMMMDVHDKYDLNRPSNDLLHAQQDIANAARETLSSEDAAIVTEVARAALRPNLLFNAQKTELARDNAAQTVAPVYEQISRGDKIIGVDEKVTQEDLDKFTALGLRNPHLALETGVGVCILAAVMVLLVIYFIGRALPKLYGDTRRLMLLSVIVLISVFGLKVGGTFLGLSISSGQAGYLGMMTVVAAGMLVSVLLDMPLAVLVVALLAVQSGLIMNHEIRFTVMTLMSSLVGIFTVGNVRRKTNLPVVTLALAGVNLALVWLMGMIQRDSLLELLTGSLWAIVSAAFATFLYWFGVMVLEKPFGILTHQTLLEMSAADRPLLQQLCMVAPGTYAHSMMVGTLAEAGAQAIGADALLCRVGGYYHDVGKMRRPEFFVENQRNGNVHGRLSPSLSALIITAHVRDGLEIAKENRLPREIADIIAEHHGTTLIRYFYHQALTDCGGTDEAPPGLEERFRYPGPRPASRESAIVMLADSVEAAARCLNHPTQEAVSGLITTIVRDKMEDGQFDECRLTFHEVKQVTDGFLHVLTAMLHARVEYPKEFPRTATGIPMEVVRGDLPASETMALLDDRLPAPGTGNLLTDKAPKGGEILANTNYGEMAAAAGSHVEANDAADATGYGESLLSPNGATPSLSAVRMKSLNPLGTPRPLISSEAEYGSFSGERPDAPGPNLSAPAGVQPTAPRGKPDSRAGGHPSHG